MESGYFIIGKKKSSIVQREYTKRDLQLTVKTKLKLKQAELTNMNIN